MASRCESGASETLRRCDKRFLGERIDHVLDESNLAGYGPKRTGKVRDIYGQGDSLVLVTTDRYSAFDRNIACIPFKGQAVNLISNFWFERTGHIIPNHVVSCPDPNVTVAKRVTPLPIEVVMRGFLTGITNTSLWTLYERGERHFDGLVLPEGMRKNQPLERPLLTPATKALDHDRPISAHDILHQEIIEPALWERIRTAAFQLFGFGQELAAARGLILVDTKYEFGLDSGGELVLIDELHTPDSSRYWDSSNYLERSQARREPDYYDKEFLRKWIKRNGDPYGTGSIPPIPDSYIVEQAWRYVHIYERLTGRHFQPEQTEPINDRIKHNLSGAAVRY